jgi:hypothetical protein
MNTPITILAMPKPFDGHIGIIQRNAITSWTKLEPRPEIILFGTEEGVAECAAELGLEHVPEVARNQYGTPLLSDLFARAEARATQDMLAYVNADIVLPSEFTPAIEKTRQAFGNFLAVGRRTNLEVGEAIDFSNGWEGELKKRTQREGLLESHTGIDFFVFPRGTYRDVPPLAIGRVWFDQWCIKYARENGLPVIDLTPFVPIVHQLHEYNHVAGGKEWVYGGAEANENLAFYGEKPHAYTILSATHELMADGKIRRVLFREGSAAVRGVLWKIFVEKTVGLRRRLGLSRSAGG